MPGGSQMPYAIPRAQLRNVFLSVNVLLDPFTARTAGPARTPAGPTMLRNGLRRANPVPPPVVATALGFASLQAAVDSIVESSAVPLSAPFPAGSAVLLRNRSPASLRFPL